MTIKLAETEREYLVTVVLKNHSSLMNIIEQSTKEKGKFLIDIDNVLADEIRDLCSEQLQKSGFDENYNLNEEGKMLEKLIDIFYVD
jgi:hypothetical protein